MNHAIVSRREQRYGVGRGARPGPWSDKGRIYPSIHSNGTGHAGLRKQYDEAIEGLRLAMEGLRETQPHGRDYYPQGDEAFTQARKEYLERDAKLRSVFDDLIHLRHVLEGVGEKR